MDRSPQARGVPGLAEGSVCEEDDDAFDGGEDEGNLGRMPRIFPLSRFLHPALPEAYLYWECENQMEYLDEQ